MSKFEALLNALKSEIKPEIAKVADLGLEFAKGVIKQAIPPEDVLKYLVKINKNYEPHVYYDRNTLEKLELYDLDAMLAFSIVLIGLIDATKQDEKQ